MKGKTPLQSSLLKDYSLLFWSFAIKQIKRIAALKNRGIMDLKRAVMDKA